MKKWIMLSVILILAISVWLGIVYLNKVFIPKKLRPRLAEIVSDRIQRKVEFGTIDYRLFRGFVLEDLKIYDEPPHTDSLFLSVKSIRFNILFLPLLKSRKIIIPSIYIDSPIAHLRYNKDKTHNIPIPEQPDKAGKGLTVLVSRIIIRNAKLSLADQTKHPLFLREIQELNSRLSLSLPHSLKISLTAIIQNSNQTKTPVSLKGTYDIKKKAFSLESKLEDVPLSEYNPYLRVLPISVSAAQIKELEISASGDKDSIDSQYSSVVEDIRLLKNDIKISGAFSLEGELKFNLPKKEIDYAGNVDVVNANITGLTFIDSVTNLKGKIDFSKDLLKTDSLSAQALESSFEINGRLSDFTNPFVDLKLKSKLKLANLNETIKDLLEKQSKQISLDLEGKAILDSRVRGYLKDLDSLQVLADIKLVKVKLSTPELASPLEEIDGSIKLEDDTLRWQDLSLKYGKNKFKLDGQLKDFASPVIETRVSGADLELDTKFALLPKHINITYLDAGYLNSNSKINLSGSLNLKQIKTPFIDLEGDLSLALQDIPHIFSRIGRDVNLPNLGGIFQAQVSVDGLLPDIRDLNISLTGKTEQLSIKEFKLRNLRLSFNQSNNQGRLRLTSEAYKGNLSVSCDLNLLDEDVAYSSQINIEGIDLARLKLDTPFKDKNTSGRFSARANLNGQVKNLSRLTGQANLRIADGNLWELNLLKGLGKLLFPACFERVVFNQASGDFLIRETRVFTNNLKFSSEQLNLAFDGNFDFAGNLNFNVTTNFSQELQEEASQDLEQILSSILTQAQRYIVVKVSGTFRQPKYKIQPRVENLLEGLFDLFKVP